MVLHREAPARGGYREPAGDSRRRPLAAVPARSERPAGRARPRRVHAEEVRQPREPRRGARTADRPGPRRGAPYRFDLIRRNPNTIDAHRVVRWAADAGQEAEIVERLFTDYFVNGRDVGDHQILADAAESVGLDRATTLTRLASPHDRAAVEAEIAAAQRIGVTGVPCFIIARKYGVMGAQTADVLANAIRQAAAELSTAA